MSAVPYDYYPAVLYALEQINQGKSKTRACDLAKITVTLFETYVKNDQHLQTLYIDAERRGHDAMADALLRPDQGDEYGQTNPQMAKVVSDNIKWYLSKKDQKRFGEKIEIKHEFTLDRAITDAMDAARKRVLDTAVATIDLAKEDYELLPAPVGAENVLTEDAEAAEWLASF